MADCQIVNLNRDFQQHGISFSTVFINGIPRMMRLRSIFKYGALYWENDDSSIGYGNCKIMITTPEDEIMPISRHLKGNFYYCDNAKLFFEKVGNMLFMCEGNIPAEELNAFIETFEKECSSVANFKPVGPITLIDAPNFNTQRPYPENKRMGYVNTTDVNGNNLRLVFEQSPNGDDYFSPIYKPIITKQGPNGPYFEYYGRIIIRNEEGFVLQ